MSLSLSNACLVVPLEVTELEEAVE